jgi:hypothetical protein
MDDLIQQITSKYGLSADQAKELLGTVTGFLKQQIPEIGDKLDGIVGSLGGAASAAGDQAGELVGAAAGSVSGAADSAQDAGSGVMDKVKGVFGG